MRALILVAAAACLAATACHDDASSTDQNIVVDNGSDDNAVTPTGYQRCPNGDLIPLDQACPPRTTPAA